MTKEKFVRVINEIKKLHEYEEELYQLNHKYDRDIVLDYPTLEDVAVTLLEEVMHCVSDDIGYFIYDLDFGAQWKPGDVTDIDGKDIDFSTAEKLYDYLKDVADKRTKV